MAQNHHGNGLPKLKPDVRLLGSIDERMVQGFLDQCANLEGSGAVVLELSTIGGEAESARRLAEEIHLLGQERDVFFLGKTYVYSAGITLMAAVPSERRYLTRDTILLVHERRMQRTVELSGALRSAVAVAKDLLAEMEIGERLERRGFERLVAGSRMTVDSLLERVLDRDWYVSAQEALELQLVAGLVG